MQSRMSWYARVASSSLMSYRAAGACAVAVQIVVHRLAKLGVVSHLVPLHGITT